MDELAIIEGLKEIFASRVSGENEYLRIGIGDDAALFTPRARGVAVATDILVEGVHFNRAWSDLYAIGRKATAANLADIYAMGLPASYLLVAVAFDPADGDAIFDLAKGIADECSLAGTRVIGGDLSRANELTVSMTAIGEGERVVTRSGARPGDGIYLTSLPGRSLLGLEQLRRGITRDPQSIAFHKSPQVDYQAFLSVAIDATSLSDISDGILIDAAALARASGLTFEIESKALESHPDFAAIADSAFALGLDPLEIVLTSGEEHGPLFTAPPTWDSTPLKAWRIGVTSERGNSLLTLDGKEIAERGFTHF
jgi:thiamine-monophosphate kinase